MNTYYTYNFPELESFYPEIYKELFPFVAEAVSDFVRKGQTLTAELLRSIIDEIIRKAGMWDEDGETEDSRVRYSAAAPLRRVPRRHHNRNTLRDLLRIIFLRELLGGNRF